MDKVKTTQEIDNILNSLLTVNLIRHTCQFFEKGNKGLKPYGSGVFVVIYDVHFIFTASHVADAFKDEKKDLFIRVSKKDFINVLGEIKYTDLEKSVGVDLAYIKLDNQMIEPLKKAYTFLTVDKIRRHNKMLDAMNYCVVGFPENNIRRDKGFLETGASAYFTIPMNNKPYEYYKYDPNDWFIVEMKGKGSDIKTGKKVEVNTHFNGISGCGLWLILLEYDQKLNNYTYDYRLIGIMTEFKKGKYFCLIGNKIQLMFNALEYIENMKFNEIKTNE